MPFRRFDQPILVEKGAEFLKPQQRALRSFRPSLTSANPAHASAAAVRPPITSRETCRPVAAAIIRDWGSVQADRGVSTSNRAHSGIDGKYLASGRAAQTSARSSISSSARPRAVSDCFCVNHVLRDGTR